MRVKSNHGALVTLSRITGDLPEGNTCGFSVIEDVAIQPGEEVEVHEGFRSTPGVAALVAEGVISVLDEAPPERIEPEAVTRKRRGAE